MVMRRHRHEFVEKYDGLMAFGYSREEDERSLVVFLQKFSDDDHMKLLASRLSDLEIEELVDRLTGLMKKYMSEEEYHRHFLKD
jgi:hypothetical protein